MIQCVIGVVCCVIVLLFVRDIMLCVLLCYSFSYDYCCSFSLCLLLVVCVGASGVLCFSVLRYCGIVLCGLCVLELNFAFVLVLYCHKVLYMCFISCMRMVALLCCKLWRL